MEIIPVLDLMHGNVVHARMGLREHYQSIQSLLCNSSIPMDIINALLELYPFKCIYIADLDSITGQGNHLPTILDIQKKIPDIEIWLDAGINNLGALKNWEAVNVTHVIGTENIVSMNDMENIHYKLNGNFILSLDYNKNGFLGCDELQWQSALWPEKVIVMTMNQVGSQLGADIRTLEIILKNTNGRKIYAAGGVRNNQDIENLKNLNIAGALIATALHNKNLNL